MNRSLLLSALLSLALCGCVPSEADRRADFAPDQQIKTDVIAYLDATYGLKLTPTALNVSLSCTVMNSRCDLVVRADAHDAGLDRRFVLWPRYEKQGVQFVLQNMDDNLRPQIVQQTLQAYVEPLLEAPDAPKVTIRVREFNDFVGIEPQLPTDLPTLSNLSAPELLQQFGQGVGLNLFVYVLDTPTNFEPRARAGLERLLADPALNQLGHGLDIRWYFRKERVQAPSDSADTLIQDGAGKWLPDGSQENTQAKWQLPISGRAFGNDLDESIDTLWARRDQQEPMLTQ